jgi:hypothetical protein
MDLSPAWRDRSPGGLSGRLDQHAVNRRLTGRVSSAWPSGGEVNVPLILPDRRG